MPKFFTVGKKKKDSQTNVTATPGTVSYGDTEEIQGDISSFNCKNLNRAATPH
jgi:hypothetical protein